MWSSSCKIIFIASCKSPSHCVWMFLLGGVWGGGDCFDKQLFVDNKNLI